MPAAGAAGKITNYILHRCFWKNRHFYTFSQAQWRGLFPIRYQFSFLPFACLACLCASLCSRTLVHTSYPTRCVDLSTYVIKSFEPFWFFFTHPPIVFRFLFWDFPPPRVVSLTFSFLSLFYLQLPFQPFPTSLQPACFTFLFLSPCVASVLCGRTGESDWRGECAVLPTTFPQHRTQTQRTRTFLHNPRQYLS